MSCQHLAPAKLMGAALGLWAALLPLHRAHARGPVSQRARELALSENARASAAGSNAVFVNPAGLSIRPEFASTVQYRLDTSSRTHGLGVMVHDSLNNPRFAMAVSYAYMKGSPRIDYTNFQLAPKELKLSHFGHEAALHVGVTVLPSWIYLGAAIGYQYASLRYKDAAGKGQEMLKALNMVGIDVGLTGMLGRWARVSAVGYNLLGSHPSNLPNPAQKSLVGTDQALGTPVVPTKLALLSDYPMSFAHSVAVYPLGRPVLSITTDGLYDFSSFKDSVRKSVRTVYGVGAEYQAGSVPLRVGARWDSMGKGSEDDQVWVGGGVAYTKPAAAGQPGFDFAFGLSQQVAGAYKKSTRLALTLSFHLHPQY